MACKTTIGKTLAVIGTICHIYLFECCLFSHLTISTMSSFSNGKTAHFIISFYLFNSQHTKRHKWSITIYDKHHIIRNLIQYGCGRPSSFEYEWCIMYKYNFRIFLAFSLYSCSINQSNELNSLDGRAFVSEFVYVCVAIVNVKHRITDSIWMVCLAFFPYCSTVPLNESIKYYKFISKWHTAGSLIEFFFKLAL